MSKSDWNHIRGWLEPVLNDAGANGDGLDGIQQAVGTGALDLSRLGDVVDGVGLDNAAAVRLVRLWKTLLEHPEVARDGEAVAVASLLARHGSYPASRLMGHPTLATWLSETRWRSEPMPREEMAHELAAYLDAIRVGPSGLEQPQVATSLRRFRHRHLLRIFLREIEGASVRRTTAEVADVAQVCLEAALSEAARLQKSPDLVDRVCVLGMGKLGGRELNFSSDVDLVFVVADGGDTDDNHQRMGPVQRLVRQVVELIDELTDEGRVFRVDLRLRPDGSRGQLIPTESGLVNYYLNWGRSWERGAWLKARHVAGSADLAERILHRLDPFLFRRYLDFEAIDELRRMKEMIDHQARAADFVRRDEKEQEPAASPSSSPFKERLLSKFNHRVKPESAPKAQKQEALVATGWDVKVGRGGIREIEFFVQALQLVHCGLRPELRVRNTLDALDRLLYAGLVSSIEHNNLTDAYDLFRRLEHRIQMKSDRQAHRVPGDSARFQDLAGRMGMSPPAMRRAIDAARADVQAIFERLFSDSAQDARQTTVGKSEPGILERIIGLSADRLLDESVIQRLRRAGFSMPRQVAGQLQVLRRKKYGPFSESPSSANPPVARHLLRAVRDAPDPEAALGQLVRFSTAVGDTPAAWTMLSDNPHAARLLIHLFGSSPPIGRLLADEPDVFERLIYGGSAQLTRSREVMEADLNDRLHGTDDRARRMGRIHRFHREEMVRIALHEVAGAVEVEMTCRQLSDLAELVLSALFREVVREFFRTHDDLRIDGDPVDSVGLCVLAMGKFGAREMGFGSDLDFIFVYDSHSEDALQHRQATRLAKRLVRALSAASAIGDLYEVDLRLRPSGGQGALVVSHAAWRAYHRERADFWERQALVRARPLTGSIGLREGIEKDRQALAFDRPLPDDARSKVASMRKKLKVQARGKRREFDVKFDDGGLVDVEFLTQWLQLCAGETAAVRTERSTFDVLRILQDAAGGHASGADLIGLRRDYGWLRRLECRLSIGGAGPVVPAQGPARRAVVRQMGHQGRDGARHFDAELNAVRQRVRRAWSSVFGDDESE